MLKSLVVSSLVGSVAWLMPAPAAFAQSRTADVVHVFTSAGERQAAKALADHFAQAGGTWTDVAVAGSAGPLRTTTNRILAGDPPSAAQFSTSGEYADFLQKGLLSDIEDVAAAEGWRDHLPEPVLDAISYQGKIYLAPIGMHAPNWIWYNTEILQKAGVTPPTALNDDFFAAMDKVRSAGFIPFAFSGQPAQERFVFEAFLLSLGGQAQWNAVWRDKNPDAIRSETTRKAFENYKRLHDYIDPGYSGRTWNQTLDLVITGKAAFDVLGDWAKAEFAAAGQSVGREFGCVLVADTMILHGDMFGFPVQTQADKVPAQKLLAKVLMEPGTQLDFAKAKGAIPPRTDVDIAGFDACATKAAAAFRNPQTVVGNARSYISPAALGDYLDLLAEYFDDPDMSAEDAVERFAGILEDTF